MKWLHPSSFSCSIGWLICTFLCVVLYVYVAFTFISVDVYICMCRRACKWARVGVGARGWGWHWLSFFCFLFVCLRQGVSQSLTNAATSSFWNLTHSPMPEEQSLSHPPQLYTTKDIGFFPLFSPSAVSPIHVVKWGAMNSCTKLFPNSRTHS